MAKQLTKRIRVLEEKSPEEWQSHGLNNDAMRGVECMNDATRLLYDTDFYEWAVPLLLNDPPASGEDDPCEDPRRWAAAYLRVILEGAETNNVFEIYAIEPSDDGAGLKFRLPDGQSIAFEELSPAEQENYLFWFPALYVAAVYGRETVSHILTRGKQNDIVERVRRGEI